MYIPLSLLNSMVFRLQIRGTVVWLPLSFLVSICQEISCPVLPPDSYPVAFRAVEERRRRGFWEGDAGRAKGYGKDELGENSFVRFSVQTPRMMT